MLTQLWLFQRVDHPGKDLQHGYDFDEIPEVNFLGLCRLGIGAAVPRQSQTVLSNDPAERRLRAKLDAEKRRKLKSSEASTISNKDGKVDEESDEDESESKSKAFTKKRPAPLPSTLQVKKKK